MELKSQQRRCDPSPLITIILSITCLCLFSCRTVFNESEIYQSVYIRSMKYNDRYFSNKTGFVPKYLENFFILLIPSLRDGEENNIQFLVSKKKLNLKNLNETKKEVLQNYYITKKSKTFLIKENRKTIYIGNDIEKGVKIMVEHFLNKQSQNP